MPYNVLHILGTAQPEGAGIARCVGALARGLDPDRFRVHACFLGGDGPLAAELRAAGADVSCLDWQRGARDVLGGWNFWRGVRGGEFAIVHQHYGGRAPRWLARWATGGSIIHHLWGHVVESRNLETTALSSSRADVVIAISHAVAKHAVDSQPRVVYPGVCIPRMERTSAETSRTKRGVVLGTAGRLVPLKGIPYLIRALALLRSEILDVSLEIAGDGPDRAALEEETERLGLAECVAFLGWQPDLLPVLSRWDVYVQPSVEEPFGIAAVEAMAGGLPVVATAAGGLPEIVEDGQTGWLIPPRDHPALAARLKALVLDPNRRRTMGAAGQERARLNFSIDRMVTAISKIYEELLSRSQRAANGSKSGRSLPTSEQCGDK